MTIQAVVTQAQAWIKAGISKIQSAPDYPTDARISVPTSIAYADNERFFIVSAGFTLTKFDLKIDIMMPRNDLENTFKYMEGMTEAIAALFMADTTINGTCQTFEGEITAVLAGQNIGGIDYIGYRMTVPNIKI